MTPEAQHMLRAAAGLDAPLFQPRHRLTAGTGALRRPIAAAAATGRSERAGGGAGGPAGMPVATRAARRMMRTQFGDGLCRRAGTIDTSRRCTPQSTTGTSRLSVLAPDRAWPPGTMRAPRPRPPAQALTEAAGIEIPRADFVIKVLAVYLLVLVPLNWLVFWLMGRVEWAWIAAPIIALVGAGRGHPPGAARHRLRPQPHRDRRARSAGRLRAGPPDALHGALYLALEHYTLGFDEPVVAGPAVPRRQARDDSPSTIATYTDVRFRRDKETSLTRRQGLVELDRHGPQRADAPLGDPRSPSR